MKLWYTNGIMAEKTIDCVEMMHLGAEYGRHPVAGMTLEEEAEFWRHQLKS